MPRSPYNMNMHRLVATLVAAVVIGAVPLAAPVAAQQLPDSTARRQQRALDSLATAMRGLQARLDSLTRAANTPAANAPATAAPMTPRAAGAYMNTSFVGQTAFGWSSTRDVESLQRGDHDPKVRGFSLRNAELSLDGAVDPYFKAVANIVYKLDPNGETGVELEDLYAVTTSLPLNLQIKAGQFFAEFGRQNPQHPHAWAFADQPLVLTRMFGPDGLRSTGARVSWLLPTPFYAEAMLAVMNSAGATASFRSDESSEIHGATPFDRPVIGVGEMLYVPRLTTSVDLTDTQTLLIGASGAFGPNTGGATSDTRILGADLYWKWKSARANQGFPFVSIQSEYIARAYDTDARVPLDDATPTLLGATLKDDGAYAQLLWGIRPRIVAGLRGEYAEANEATYVSAERANRSRWSPSLTWYPTEFSKLRIQYNYDNRAGIGIDHSVWMQFEFLLGAHAAHKF